jgi:hypothetical protein
MDKNPTMASIEALEEIKKYNRLRNDLDAYLYEVADWGLGIRKEPPNPEDYGIN